MKTTRGFGTFGFIAVGVACFIAGFISAKMVYFDAHQGSSKTVKAGKPEHAQAEADAVSASNETIGTETNVSDELDISEQLDQLAEGEVLIVKKDGTFSVANRQRRTVGDRDRVASRSNTAESDGDAGPDDQQSNVTLMTRKELANKVPEKYMPIFAPPEGRRLNSDNIRRYQKNQETVQQFEEQEKDTQWGYDVKSQLEIFFYSHENIHELKVDSIECREYACQIFSRELRAGVSRLIMSDLRQQAWFKKLKLSAMSHQTTNHATGDNVQYTYLYPGRR